MLSNLDLSHQFLLLMVLNSMFLMTCSSPFSMLFSVVSHTLLVCVLLKCILSTSWFSLLLFLIFLGGLMILFSYVTSLSPNNPLSIYNIKYKHLLFLIFASSSLMLVASGILNSSILMNYVTTNIPMKIYSVYSPHTSIIFLMLFFFLLLALIVSVYIILMNSATLRKILKN